MYESPVPWLLILNCEFSVTSEELFSSVSNLLGTVVPIPTLPVSPSTLKSQSEIVLAAPPCLPILKSALAPPSLLLLSRLIKRDPYVLILKSSATLPLQSLEVILCAPAQSP